MVKIDPRLVLTIGAHMRLLPAASIALLLGSSSLTALAPTAASAYGGFEFSVGVAPPFLPYYDQPPIPADGYIWTPGYWAWDNDVGDYYWVPGTWVLPPQPGYYWTPGYWAFDNGQYVFYDGYWGPEVGFYGGVDYGFGYNGYGYYGGQWRGGRFFYNRTVNNVANRPSLNIYDQPITRGGARGRLSFNGGPGGIQLRPTPQQQAIAHAPHIGVTALQKQHIQAARSQPTLRASVNNGAPPIGATVRPGLMRGPGITPGVGAGLPFTPPASTGPGLNAARGPGGRTPVGSVHAAPAVAPPPVVHLGQPAPPAQAQYRPGNNHSPQTPGNYQAPGDYQGGRPNAFAPTVHYGIPPASPPANPPPAFQRDARPGPMMGQPPQGPMGQPPLVGMRAPAVARPPAPPPPPPRPDHP
jgi:hypothetical protein